MKQKLLSLFVAACCSVTIFGGNILPLDWDNIPSEYLYSITNPANAKYKALTQMKAACDHQYLYIWAEFDTKYLDTNENLEGPGYTGNSTPFHVFLTDGKQKGCTWMWSESTPAAILMEGFLFKSGKPINYNPLTFQWPDYEESSSDWLWAEIYNIQPIVGSVVTDRTVELAINLANLPLIFDQYIYVGIEIEKEWSTVGVLPYQTLDGEGNVKKQEMAKVKISPNLLSGTFIDHLAYDFDSETKTATVIGCDSGLTNITIPETITYQEQTYSVTTIEDRAFQNCSSLTSITIPNSVTTIGEGAFSGCSGLTKTNYTGTIADWCKISFELMSANPIRYSHNLYINDVEVKDLVIPNSVTEIEMCAFYGCSGLTSVTIPNSVTMIGWRAFEGCTGLTSITCFAVYPPSGGLNIFDGINPDVKVYVLASSLSYYQSFGDWQYLNLLPIGADETPMEGEEPIVTPSNQDVTITWPITDGTNTYTLTISSGGEVVCVLTFNANGQLTNIAFAAPGHGNSHQAPAATLTAQGYQFTVTGLNPGTSYNYNVTATDAKGKTLAEHKGNFITTGGESDLPNVRNGEKASKYFHNGQILLERNNATYTLMGQKVR